MASLTTKHAVADAIDADLVRLANRARYAGLEELAVELSRIRPLARKYMSAEQRAAAPH